MKTIEELITALESGVKLPSGEVQKYAKSKGQFQVNETDALNFDDEDHPVGFCCLGVYATFSNLNFSRDQAIFGWPTDDQLIINKARLPADHFLIEKIHLPESSFLAAGYDVQLQSYLTDLNDDSETFEPVIRALKAFAGGQRAFPPAPTFIEAVEG